MKLLPLLLVFITSFSNLSLAQTTVIPDANFEQALIDLGYDSGTPDGIILTANIDTITSLHIGNKNINDLTGIQDFNALTELDCWGNQLINLDVTQNIALSKLYCNFNQLTSLDVSLNTALTELICTKNKITGLDLSQNIYLTFLHCSDNFLSCLNVKNGNNTNLHYFKLQTIPI